MTPYYEDSWLTVYGGDCRDVMRELEPESVHCVVTSPPYWGLRDYGDAGQLGLESTPEEYVANLVDVFREVRRVLRADGTVWLNLGDSYAGSGRGGNPPDSKWSGFMGSKEREAAAQPHLHTNAIAAGAIGRDWVKPPPGLKQKDLVGIPWRVAFALHADGWYLRSDIIWAKPNPMPESVTDRPTKSHEYLFLLSKRPTYYFDADAVREEGTGRTAGNVGPVKGAGSDDPYFRTREGFEKVADKPWTARNLRSVWTIATQPYPGAHFATFPRKLVEPCVKAGTSERGVCPECGSPWVRVVERAVDFTSGSGKAGRPPSGKNGDDYEQATSGSYDIRMGPSVRAATIGWRPSCEHEPKAKTCICSSPSRDWCVTHNGRDLRPVPATILDPFAGSGTTGAVAQALNRRAILIDLNPDYLAQAMGRNRDIPLGLGAA